MFKDQMIQANILKEYTDSEYVHNLENEVDTLCQEYIFMMSFDVLKSVTILYLKIGRFYSEHGNSGKALNSYIKAMDYVEYAVSETETDEIISYYKETVDYLYGFFKLLMNNDSTVYERAALVNHYIIVHTDEEIQLGRYLSKNLRLGSFLYKHVYIKEANLFFKNAVNAGRKLLTLYPWSANADNLARGFFGYAKTVDTFDEKMMYAREALDIFEDLMQSDYYQWEKYEGEKKEVEDYIRSLLNNCNS